VRDGLSLLDQAIAHGDGAVSGDHVRAMLGLADRGRVFDLLETVLKGNARQALEALASLHADGAEPLQVLNDMAEAVHVITRMVAAGMDAADPTLSEGERAHAEKLAGQLDMPGLARAWQMLLKGIGEVSTASRPAAAAEMVLVRMAYLADAPTPDKLAGKFGEGKSGENSADKSAGPVQGEAPSAAPSAPAPATSGAALQAHAIEPEAFLQEESPIPDEAEAPETAEMPESFEQVVALVEEHRDIMLSRALQEGVRLVSFAPPLIEINLEEGAPASVANDLRMFLSKATGQSWMVAVSDQPGEETLAAQAAAREQAEREREAAERETLKNHPAVKAVMEYFPEAVISDIRPIGIDEEDQ
jgi:DNA polymerase-3 subunit gamma/tau